MAGADRLAQPARQDRKDRWDQLVPQAVARALAPRARLVPPGALERQGQPALRVRLAQQG